MKPLHQKQSPCLHVNTKLRFAPMDTEGGQIIVFHLLQLGREATRQIVPGRALSESRCQPAFPMVDPSADQADTGSAPDGWTNRWQPGRAGRTAGYAAFSPTHTRTKGAHRSALTGQASSLDLGGAATSTAEKPLFPAPSAVDAKI